MYYSARRNGPRKTGPLNNNINMLQNLRQISIQTNNNKIKTYVIIVSIHKTSWCRADNKGVVAANELDTCAVCGKKTRTVGRAGGWTATVGVTSGRSWTGLTGPRMQHPAKRYDANIIISHRGRLEYTPSIQYHTYMHILLCVPLHLYTLYIYTYLYTPLR